MDFGDIIFFIVFVVIIVSNIMKAMKKAGKQTSGNKKSETQSAAPPAKKTGWKKVLEQMLEEARKQMENATEPEPTDRSVKHPTGWEDIVFKKDPAKRKPEKISETVKASRPPVIDDDHIRENATFWPECMRCNDPMKAIVDLGTGKQAGLIYCDSCGEQHKYQILNGELRLKQVEMARKKAVIAPERSYRKVEERRRAQGKIPAVDILPAGKIKIPRQMSQADLRTAVVWSEILGKPLGLRDIEG